MHIKRIWTLPALLLITVTAHAGFVQPQPVVIDMDAGFAQGDLISARNSENEFEYIGCGIRSYDYGGGVQWQTGFCQARMDEASFVTCNTESVALLEGINILSDSSFVIFAWTEEDNGSLTCNYIGSSTQSFYLGKGKNNLAD